MWKDNNTGFEFKSIVFVQMEPLLNRFLRLAQREAYKSKNKYKLGCCIVKNGKVIGKGHNENSFNRLFGSGFSCYNHAESSAITDAFSRVWDLKGCKAYIFRKGNFNSRPCETCMRHLKSVGIKKIFYTCEGNLIEEKV